jgi:hypothetical protein
MQGTTEDSAWEENNPSSKQSSPRTYFMTDDVQNAQDPHGVLISEREAVSHEFTMEVSTNASKKASGCHFANCLLCKCTLHTFHAAQQHCLLRHLTLSIHR